MSNQNQIPKSKRLTIGLFIKNTMGDYYGENKQWRGVLDGAKESGVNLITFLGGVLKSLRGYESQSNVIYEFAHSDEIDGLIIWSGGLNWYLNEKEMFSFIKSFQDKPIVSVECEYPGVSSILMDDYQGMTDVMQHMLGFHGYKKIAFLRGPQNHNGAQNRYRAYLDTMKEFGLEPDPQWISEPEESWDGRKAVLSLIKRKIFPGVEALVGACDAMLSKSIKILGENGIHYPYDIAMAGFDNNFLTNVIPFPFTTIAPPFYEMGKRAVKMIIDEIQGKKSNQKECFPTYLIVRQSCGCAFQKKSVNNINQAILNINSSTENKNIASCDFNDIIKRIQESGFSVPTEDAQLIWESFCISIEKNDSSFLKTLENILYHKIKTSLGQNKITGFLILIKKALPLVFQNNPDRLIEGEGLLTKAFLLLSNVGYRIYKFEQLKMIKKQQVFRGVSQNLLTAYSKENLLDVITSELPLLKINSCYLSVFESPESSLKFSRLILAFDDSGRTAIRKGGKRHLSDQLLPKRILQGKKRMDCLITSLYSQKHQIGFVIYGVGPKNIFVYESLAPLISSALIGSELVQEVELRALELSWLNTKLEKVNEKLENEVLLTKHLAEEISYSEEKYRTLFESSSDAIILFRLDNMKIFDVNKTAEKICGYSRDEMINNQTMTDLIPEFKEMPKLLEKKEIKSLPLVWFKKKNGDFIPLEITSGMFLIRSVRTCFAIMRNISEFVSNNMRQTQLIQKMNSIFEEVKNFTDLVSADVNYFGPQKYLSDYAITRQEDKVIYYLVQGLQNKEIAEKLFISVDTIRWHVHSILKKMNLKNRVELIYMLRNKNIKIFYEESPLPNSKN
jgi:PAS domain S-box-containing protein